MVSDILSVTTHGDEETHNMNSIFRVDSGGAVVVNQDISYQNYRYFQFDVSYVFIHILYVCSAVCMCMYVHTQAVHHPTWLLYVIVVSLLLLMVSLFVVVVVY